MRARVSDFVGCFDGVAESEKQVATYLLHHLGRINKETRPQLKTCMDIYQRMNAMRCVLDIYQRMNAMRCVLDIYQQMNAMRCVLDRWPLCVYIDLPIIKAQFVSTAMQRLLTMATMFNKNPLTGISADRDIKHVTLVYPGGEHFGRLENWQSSDAFGPNLSLTESKAWYHSDNDMHNQTDQHNQLKTMYKGNPNKDIQSQ